MKKTIIIILKTIRYSGDSIGNDIHIAGEVFGRKFSFTRKIKRGETARIDTEIGRTETDNLSFAVPLTFQVTEKDFLFPDIGKKTETMIVDLNGERIQNKVITVEVREKKLRAGKRKALFDITCEATIQKDQASSFADKSIAWWEEWKTIKQYSYRGVNGKEDYNRYDPIIKSIVAKWNKEFCDDLFPPDVPLDPNLVKAIIFQESRVGYDRAAGINIMQVGNPGDSSLKTLRGELKEYWIHNGKLQELAYDARVTTVEESILWGARWLYHKAQKPLSEEKRIWLLWREAVKRYGPGKDAYVKSVWDIYMKGVKKEKNRTSTLWIITLFMALIGSAFAYQSTQPSLAAMVMKTIIPEDRFSIEGIQAEPASGQSLFWSIVAREKDWWEELRVGRKRDGSIQWLTFDTYPTEQSILKVRFLTLQGFDKPILEVYGQTHMGNGALYLYEVGDINLRLLLEMPGAVDVHNENAARPEHQKQYGYFQCGEVIEGDTLTSEYSDLNSDGIDDLTLSGTTRVICEKLIGFDKRGYVQTEDVTVERRKEKERFIWDMSQWRYVQQ